MRATPIAALRRCERQSRQLHSPLLRHALGELKTEAGRLLAEGGA